MHFLKVLFLLIVLVAVIEAQKGGTKSRPKPANVPTAPAGRKTPQPRPVQPKPIPQQPQEPDDSGSAGNAIEENNGESGPEPPAVVPQTSFTCDDKPYQPGMYADMEVDCSVYHMCFDGRKESFLCGTGTMFNQEILSCDHMGKVNCANSPQYYEANTELGKPGAEPASQPAQSGSKGAAAPAPAPRQQQPRPRVQQPSKTSQPRPAPAPKQQPKPFEEEPEEEQPQDEPEETPQPPPRPAPAPQPRPKSKTSPPKPRPQPVAQPKKAPAPKQKPIVQSFVDSEPENNVRRAYRARY